MKFKFEVALKSTNLHTQFFLPSLRIFFYLFPGAIYDLRKSYDDVFYVVGCLYLIDALLFASIVYLQKRRAQYGGTYGYNTIAIYLSLAVSVETNSQNQMYDPVADPGFPVAGVDQFRACRPPMGVPFGENVCKNERIGSCRRVYASVTVKNIPRYVLAKAICNGHRFIHMYI